MISLSKAGESEFAAPDSQYPDDADSDPRFLSGGAVSDPHSFSGDTDSDPIFLILLFE
jgi:hypothetical protein